MFDSIEVWEKFKEERERYFVKLTEEVWEDLSELEKNLEKLYSSLKYNLK